MVNVTVPRNTFPMLGYFILAQHNNLFDFPSQWRVRSYHSLQLPASTGSVQHDPPIIEGLGKHPKHMGKWERRGAEKKKLPSTHSGTDWCLRRVVDVDGRLTNGTYPNNRVKMLNEIWLIAWDEP